MSSRLVAIEPCAEETMASGDDCPDWAQANLIDPEFKLSMLRS